MMKLDENSSSPKEANLTVFALDSQGVRTPFTLPWIHQCILGEKISKNGYILLPKWPLKVGMVSKLKWHSPILTKSEYPLVLTLTASHFGSSKAAENKAPYPRMQHIISLDVVRTYNLQITEHAL